MKRILQTWLDHQCRLLPGSTHAVLLNGPPDQGPYNHVLFWPDDRRDHTLLSHVARVALRDKKIVIKPFYNQGENNAEPLDVMACPLFLEGRLLGGVAIELTHRSLSRLRAAMQQVQAGSRWLEAMISLPLAPSPGSEKKENRPLVKPGLAPGQSRGINRFGSRRLPLKVGVGLTAVLLVGLFVASVVSRTPTVPVSKVVIRHPVVAPSQSALIKTQTHSGGPAGDGETGVQ